MKAICLATGCFYMWNNNINGKISICKQFDIDGIELTIATYSDLIKLQLTKESINYLLTLKSNTIHAPFKGIIYKNNSRSRKALSVINKISTKINAKNIVFHPTNIQDPILIKGLNTKVSIENMNLKTKYNFEKTRLFIKNHPKFGLTLDINHTATISPEEIDKYLDFKIIEFHLSCFKDETEHLPVHHSTKEYLQTIKKVKHINAPMVIETNLPDIGNTKIVEKDIDFVKKHLR